MSRPAGLSINIDIANAPSPPLEGGRPAPLDLGDDSGMDSPVPRNGTVDLGGGVRMNADGTRFTGPSPRRSRPSSGSSTPAQRTTGSGRRVALKDLKRLKVIGQGVSGRVEMVRHVPTGEIYALKIIPLDVSVSEKQRKLLVTELTTLYEAASEYVVSFLGAF